MKKTLKAGGAILVFVALLLITLRSTGFEPWGCPVAGASWTCRWPGLWLRGNLITTPVTDWSFTDQFPNAEIQTRTWYLLPHSVTTYCVAYNGQLYVDSFYSPGIKYPHGRRWNEDVARDPHARLKIGNNLYDVTLSHDTDPSDKAAVLHLVAKKYPQLKIPPAAQVELFHVVE